MKGRIRRGRARSCPGLAGPHFSPRDRAGFARGKPRALARPMNKVRLEKQVKNLTTLREGGSPPLFSWTPAQLCHSKMLQEGPLLTDPESRTSMHCPSPCPQETALIRNQKSAPLG